MSSRTRTVERATTAQLSKAADMVLSERSFHMPTLDREASSGILSDAIRQGLISPATFAEQVSAFDAMATTFLESDWSDPDNNTPRSDSHLRAMAKQQSALVGLDLALTRAILARANGTKGFNNHIEKRRYHPTRSLAEALTEAMRDTRKLHRLCEILDFEEDELICKIRAQDLETSRLFLQQHLMPSSTLGMKPHVQETTALAVTVEGLAQNQTNVSPATDIEAEIPPADVVATETSDINAQSSNDEIRAEERQAVAPLPAETIGAFPEKAEPPPDLPQQEQLPATTRDRPVDRASARRRFQTERSFDDLKAKFDAEFGAQAK